MATGGGALERTLHASPAVPVYAVPPLGAHSKGYVAAQWQQRPPIFTARLCVVELAEPSGMSAPTPPRLRVEVRLLDPATGELFAAAPYAHPSAATPCLDSARFFALRVQGEGGMRATLGIGFEDRVEAFDFKAALADAGRSLGFAAAGSVTSAANGTNGGSNNSRTVGSQRRQEVPASSQEKATRGDMSLKEGQMMTINVSGLSDGRGTTSGDHTNANDTAHDISLFTLKPPPPPAADADAAGDPDDDDDGFGDFQ